MLNPSDEVFVLKSNELSSLPSRSMRQGLLGKNLEEALQELLEKYPQLIPGNQIEPGSDDPPQLVFLGREMPVGGWSLDLLYVDQRGVLTLVEGKLLQNPESRREVIGQIIEYAANASEFWANGRVRQKAAEFWSKRSGGNELDDVIRDTLSEDMDIEDFWDTVETNLQNGRIRLIIAADELRPEVRRMIEYLNNEMRNAEVLGLELKCYGDDTESLILAPRVIGQTQASIVRKPSSGENIAWPPDKLRAAYEKFDDRKLAQNLRTILDWAVDNKFFMENRTKFPAFGLRGKSKRRIVSFFFYGAIHLFMREMHYPGGTEERDELVNELKSLGLLDQDLDPQKVTSGCGLKRRLSELNDEELKKMLAAFDKYCG